MATQKRRTKRITRRRFLGVVGTGIAASAVGPLILSGTSRSEAAASDRRAHPRHIIPGANHERFLIKTSFGSPLNEPPHLRVGNRDVTGEMTDSKGRFWQFDVGGLKPATEYRLRIADSHGRALSDPWPLRTFPAPEAEVKRLRIVAFTCAGGYDLAPFHGRTFFLDMKTRRRLLQRALSFKPDALIANGDQIYWDQATSQNKSPALARHVRKFAFDKFGNLDLSIPMLGTANEPKFTRICDYQIASLYRTELRSIPSFFLTDDHDLLENDEGDARVMTLPPRLYGIDAERSTQHLYYSEFLPDPNRSRWIDGSSAPDRPKGVSQGFGTLRYGRLLELLLYDTKRYCTLKGIHAGMVPPRAEKWIIDRTKAEDTIHLIHCPSTPFGWTAGKLGEWYPDVLVGKAKLGIKRPKPYWPEGWFRQHQRIIEALGAQKRRAAIVIEGDLHAAGVGVMRRSKSLDLARNPIHMVLVGPLGTGDIGWPSAVRKVGATPSVLVKVQELLEPLEKNGFTVIDVTPEKVAFRLYAWRPPEPVDRIDTMGPVFTYEVKRPT